MMIRYAQNQPQNNKSYEIKRRKQSKNKKHIKKKNKKPLDLTIVNTLKNVAEPKEEDQTNQKEIIQENLDLYSTSTLSEGNNPHNRFMRHILNNNGQSFIEIKTPQNINIIDYHSQLNNNSSTIIKDYSNTQLLALQEQHSVATQPLLEQSRNLSNTKINLLAQQNLDSASDEQLTQNNQQNIQSSSLGFYYQQSSPNYTDGGANGIATATAMFEDLRKELIPRNYEVLEQKTIISGENFREENQITMKIRDEGKDNDQDQVDDLTKEELRSKNDSRVEEYNNGNNDYMNKSIEVIVQRTSNTNSKITSIKESTPDNLQFRNIYGGIAGLGNGSSHNHPFILTPNNNSFTLNNFREDYLRLSDDKSYKNNKSLIQNNNKHTTLIQHSEKKKIILKKQSQLKSNHQSRYQKTQGFQDRMNNGLLNNDLAQFGLSIKSKQSLLINQPTILSQSITQQINDISDQNREESKNNGTLVFEKSKSQNETNKQILLPTLQNKISIQSERYYGGPDSSGCNINGTNSGFANIQIYETVTQDSQIHKTLGLYENRYEVNEGSPFIYRSKENNNNNNFQNYKNLQSDQSANIRTSNINSQQANLIINLKNQADEMQHLQVSRSHHLHSHSVTPICEPIYPINQDNRTEDSKDLIIMSQEIKNQHSSRNIIIQKHFSSKSGGTASLVDLLKTNNENNLLQQNTIKIDGNEQNDEETVVVQQQHLQVSFKDSSQEYGQQEQYQENRMTLQQQILENRQKQIIDQAYKFNPYIYQRRQDEEQSRLIHSRLQKIKERQSQSLEIQGFNIRTIDSKVNQAAIEYFEQLVIQHQQQRQLQLQQEQLETQKINVHQHQQMGSQDLTNSLGGGGGFMKAVLSDSMTNSDGLLMSAVNGTTHPFGFLQNKYSFVSGQNFVVASSSKFPHNTSSMVFGSEKEQPPHFESEIDNQNYLVNQGSPQLRSPSILSKKQYQHQAKFTLQNNQSISPHKKRYLSNAESKLMIEKNRQDNQPMPNGFKTLIQQQQQSPLTKEKQKGKYFYSPTPAEISKTDILLPLMNEDLKIEIQDNNLYQKKQSIDQLGQKQEKSFNDYTFEIQNHKSQEPTQRSARISHIHYQDQLQQQFQQHISLNDQQLQQDQNQSSQIINQSNKKEEVKQLKFASQASQKTSINNIKKGVVNLSSNTMSKQSIIRRTNEDSDITSYKITKPLLQSQDKEITEAIIEGEQEYNTKSPLRRAIPLGDKTIDKDDKEREIKKKMSKSYSKMMQQIGEELRNVGPRSLKNLAYIQNTNNRIYPNDDSNLVISKINQQMERNTRTADQAAQRKRHEIHVNITASISTASFRGKQEDYKDDSVINHNQSINDHVSPSNSVVIIKQFKGVNEYGTTDSKSYKNATFNPQKKDQYGFLRRQSNQESSNNNEDVLNDTNMYQMSNAIYQHKRDHRIMSSSHINKGASSYFDNDANKSSNKIFEDPQLNEKNILIMKSTRLTQRISNLNKTNLHASFMNQNRKIIKHSSFAGTAQTTTNKNKLSHSFQKHSLNQKSSMLQSLNSQAYFIENPATTKNDKSKIPGSSTNLQAQKQYADGFSDYGLLNHYKKKDHSTFSSMAQIKFATNMRPMTASNHLPNNQNIQQYNRSSSLGSTSGYGNQQQSNTNNYHNQQMNDAQSASKINLITNQNIKERGTQGVYMNNSVKNSINPNKLDTFKKLKRGFVFKDQDFEAKQPSNGIKITNRY